MPCSCDPQTEQSTSIAVYYDLAGEYDLLIVTAPKKGVDPFPAASSVPRNATKRNDDRRFVFGWVWVAIDQVPSTNAHRS